jgi:hypothetical protein
MRYVAQGPDHNGKWWVLDKNKGRFGAVIQAGLTAEEAREFAAKLNVEKAA